MLPFENLGDSADAYFADGVANDVRTKLSQIQGLQVIARGSSNEYKQTKKSQQQIARELGVDYLLTATVQWEKGSRRESGTRDARSWSTCGRAMLRRAAGDSRSTRR